MPAGPWDARVTLRSGLLERSARNTITFPDAAGASRSLLVPAIVGVGLLLALLIAARLVVLQRRRRRRLSLALAERAPAF